eukprot:gene19896-7017_t
MSSLPPIEGGNAKANKKQTKQSALATSPKCDQQHL